jgi:predicted MFS family arabinose efflux permease
LLWLWHAHGRVSEFLGLARDDAQGSSWRTLSNRDFRWYFCGSVTSDLGTWLQNTVQVYLAFKLAHSAFDVGLVTCAQFSSPLVLGPWAGVLADRIGGRKTLLGTQLVSALIAFCMAALQLSGALGEWSLVGGALASGLAFTFALPARNVTVRRLVSAEETRPAYVMDAVSYNIGRAVAPPLGVLLIAAGGYEWAFFVNGLSFIVFTVTLLLARHGAGEPERRSRVSDGFVIARRERTIMLLLLMVAAVTIADDPVLVLGPTLASQRGVSASWSGLFIAALGVGSVLGSLRRSRHLPTLRLAAIALAALGACMVLFVATPWIAVSLAAALGAGITALLANSMTRTLLSKAAGPARVAPVMAVWAIAWAGSKPLASFADGTLAGFVGPRLTGIILALPAFAPIGYLIVRRYLPQLLARRRAPMALPAATVPADDLISPESFPVLDAT